MNSDHLSIRVCYITLTHFIEVPQTRKVCFFKKHWDQVSVYVHSFGNV